MNRIQTLSRTLEKERLTRRLGLDPSTDADLHDLRAMCRQREERPLKGSWQTFNTYRGTESAN